MKQYRMTGLALFVLLLFAAQPQTTTLAGTPFIPQEWCESNGSTWQGENPYDGRCLHPPGTGHHACAEDEYGFSDFVLESYYCESIFGSSIRPTAPRCGPVDLPRTLNPSSSQTISFKGNHLVEGAWLSIPGYDLIPVMDLVFDPDTNTWTGTVDTSHIAEGYYTPLRLLVNGRDQTKACHIGGAVVE